MPKYNVTMWYSCPRWKTFEVEAENPDSAEDAAREIIWDENVNDWAECDDADLDVDVQEITT